MEFDQFESIYRRVEDLDRDTIKNLLRKLEERQPGTAAQFASGYRQWQQEHMHPRPGETYQQHQQRMLQRDYRYIEQEYGALGNQPEDFKFRQPKAERHQVGGAPAPEPEAPLDWRPSAWEQPRFDTRVQGPRPDEVPPPSASPFERTHEDYASYGAQTPGPAPSRTQQVLGAVRSDLEEYHRVPLAMGRAVGKHVLEPLREGAQAFGRRAVDAVATVPQYFDDMVSGNLAPDREYGLNRTINEAGQSPVGEYITRQAAAPIVGRGIVDEMPLSREYPARRTLERAGELAGRDLLPEGSMEKPWVRELARGAPVMAAQMATNPMNYVGFSGAGRAGAAGLSGQLGKVATNVGEGILENALTQYVESLSRPETRDTAHIDALVSGGVGGVVSGGAGGLGSVVSVTATGMKRLSRMSARTAEAMQDVLATGAEQLSPAGGATLEMGPGGAAVMRTHTEPEVTRTAPPMQPDPEATLTRPVKGDDDITLRHEEGKADEGTNPGRKRKRRNNAPPLSEEAFAIHTRSDLARGEHVPMNEVENAQPSFFVAVRVDGRAVARAVEFVPGQPLKYTDLPLTHSNRAVLESYASKAPEFPAVFQKGAKLTDEEKALFRLLGRNRSNDPVAASAVKQPVLGAPPATRVPRTPQGPEIRHGQEPNTQAEPLAGFPDNTHAAARRVAEYQQKLQAVKQEVGNAVTDTQVLKLAKKMGELQDQLKVVGDRALADMAARRGVKPWDGLPDAKQVRALQKQVAEAERAVKTWERQYKKVIPGQIGADRARLKQFDNDANRQKLAEREQWRMRVLNELIPEAREALDEARRALAQADRSQPNPLRAQLAAEVGRVQNPRPRPGQLALPPGDSFMMPEGRGHRPFVAREELGPNGRFERGERAPQHMNTEGIQRNYLSDLMEAYIARMPGGPKGTKARAKAKPATKKAAKTAARVKSVRAKKKQPEGAPAPRDNVDIAVGKSLSRDEEKLLNKAGLLDEASDTPSVTNVVQAPDGKVVFTPGVKRDTQTLSLAELIRMGARQPPEGQHVYVLARAPKFHHETPDAMNGWIVGPDPKNKGNVLVRYADAPESAAPVSHRQQDVYPYFDPKVEGAPGYTFEGVTPKNASPQLKQDIADAVDILRSAQRNAPNRWEQIAGSLVSEELRTPGALGRLLRTGIASRTVREPEEIVRALQKSLPSKERGMWSDASLDLGKVWRGEMQWDDFRAKHGTAAFRIEALAKQLRQHSDELEQQLVAQGQLPPTRQRTGKDTDDQFMKYALRMYQAYWMKPGQRFQILQHSGQDILANARAQIVRGNDKNKGFALTDAEIDRELMDIVNAGDPLHAALNSEALKPFHSLMRRTGLPKWMQDLLGVETSGFLTLSHQIARQRVIADTGAFWKRMMETRQTVAVDGKQVSINPVWSPGPNPALGLTLQVPDNQRLYGNAAGGYTRPEFEPLVRGDPFEQSDVLFSPIAGVFKSAKVAFNPRSWVSNYLRNVVPSLVSGGASSNPVKMFADVQRSFRLLMDWQDNPTPFGERKWVHLARRYGAVAEGFGRVEALGKRQDKLFSELAELYDMPVTPRSGRDFMDGLNALAEKVNQAGDAAGREAVLRYYDMIDQMWKLMSFRNLSEKYMRQGLSEVQAMEKASYRVNRYFPNFERVGEFTDKLRRSPIGTVAPFITSALEDIRISAMTLKDGMTDLETAAGIARATAALAGVAALGHSIGWAQNWAGEEQEAVEALVQSSRDYDSARLNMGQTRRRYSPLTMPMGYDQHGRVNIVDVGTLLPFGQFLVGSDRNSIAGNLLFNVGTTFVGGPEGFGGQVASRMLQAGGLPDYGEREQRRMRIGEGHAGELLSLLGETFEPGFVSTARRIHRDQFGTQPIGAERMTPAQAAASAFLPVAGGFTPGAEGSGRANYEDAMRINAAKRDMRSQMRSRYSDSDAKQAAAGRAVGDMQDTTELLRQRREAAERTNR